jgi:hypothetical protein
MLGAEMNTVDGNATKGGFFQGYIFNFCYHNTCNVDLNYNGNPICQNLDDWCTECPESPTLPEFCLSHCAWNQYYDEDTETCIPCNDDCLTCVHGGNCDPCVDLECEICLNWETCDQCSANSEIGPDGQCVCSEGYYFEVNTYACEPCHVNCQSCTGPNFYDCPTCKTGFYRQSGTQACLPDCASGFTANDVLNACEGNNVLVFCATFEDKIIVEDENNFGVAVVGGSDSLSSDANDPLPIYRRGLYFDGFDDYLSVTNFRLHYEFTVTAWVRVTGGNNILTSNRNSYTEPNDETIF